MVGWLFVLDYKYKVLYLTGRCVFRRKLLWQWAVKKIRYFVKIARFRSYIGMECKNIGKVNVEIICFFLVGSSL